MDRKDFAGKTVKIKEDATHPQVPNFGDSEYRVEGYWDELTGGSWKDAQGNSAAIVYGLRAIDNNLPLDDEVLYGKIGPFGYLVHVSEIEHGKENEDGDNN